MKVLVLISEGLQKKETENLLKISPRTVASHVEKVYKKLSVNNAAAAVSKAHNIGIFPTENYRLCLMMINCLDG